MTLHKLNRPCKHFLAIRFDRQDVFSGILAYGWTNFNLTAGGEARRVSANWVSGDFFATLGVRPIAGRLIARADDYFFGKVTRASV